MSFRRQSTIDNRQLTNRSGQTLIEVLIAFAVTVVIALGLVTVGLTTQKAAVGARNEAQATKLAQEYVEKLRVMRDSRSWDSFVLPISVSVIPLDYRINIPAGSENIVVGWAITNTSMSTTSPCLDSTVSSVMRGEMVLVDKVNFCRKLTIAQYTAGDTKLGIKVEVGWKEGNNVRSSRAETVMSLWCGAAITGVTAAPCP